MKDLRIYGLKTVRTLVVVIAFGISVLAQGPVWKAGQFKELVTGKATRKDVVRVLGDVKPTKSGKLETYSYADKGEFGGKVLVDVNAATGIVEAITEQFSPNLTRTQAYKKYGKDYNEVRYSVSECPQEGSTPMVYRDAKGGIELLEYPKKGLILWPNQYGFDIAAAVVRAKALPGKRPQCGKK